jgi:hypothetical protein
MQAAGEAAAENEPDDPACTTACLLAVDKNMNTLPLMALHQLPSLTKGSFRCRNNEQVLFFLLNKFNFQI